MLKRNTILQHINIEKVVFNGFGLAYHHNKTILVYQGITGDDVDVKLIHKKGDTYFGVIVKYNRKSQYQVPPGCDSFDKCGGCDWLNIGYSTQLMFKEDITAEVYSHYLGTGLQMNKIVPSPQSAHYRNKIILPVTKKKGEIKAGMYARRSHQVITPRSDCILHPLRANNIIRYAQELLTKANCTVYDENSGKGILRFIGVRYSETEKNYLVIIVTKSGKLPFSKVVAGNITSRFPEVSGIVQDINTSPTNRNLSSQCKVLFGHEHLTEKLFGLSLDIHYSSFFQINTPQCINVIKTIADHLSSDDVVIDAFSGIGTIGISVSTKVRKVICMEQQPQAVKYGLANIKKNKLTNVLFSSGNVEDTLPKVIDEYDANVIIVDPPRKGLAKTTIETIVNSSLHKIIYLSCNISTQRRDIDLLDKSGFTLNSLQPFDMFPHTHHVECLAVMER